MKSIDDAPFPVPSLAAPEDMGEGLTASHWDVDLPRPFRQLPDISRIALLWVLFGSIFALAAIYHALIGEEGTATLAWSALAGSMMLFLGGLLIHTRYGQLARQNISPPSMQSWLLLLAFIFPLAQILLTLVLTQDNNVSTVLLLLVLGYAAVVATPESLLHFLVVALFGWAACQLRMPAASWLNFVIPWVATALLALAIQKRFSHHRLVSLLAATPSLRVASSQMFDVDVEQRLQAALKSQSEAETARTAAQAALEQAQSEQQANTQQWRHQHEQLSQDLQTGQQQLDQALSDIRQLEEKLEAAQVELRAAHDQTPVDSHWQEEAERWQRQAHDAETEYNSLETEYHQLEEKLKATQSEMAALRSTASNHSASEDRIAELQTKLAETERNLSTVKQHLQQAENGRRQAEKDRQEAEAVWQQTEEELNRVRSELGQEREQKAEIAINDSASAEPAQVQTPGIGPRFFSGLTRTLEPPLSSLLDHADTLLDGINDNETRRQALVGLLRHGRHFRRLLTNAFDYAHLEAGSALITKEPCSPWQLVHEVVAEQRAVAEEKGLDMVIEPGGPLPRSVTTDKERCHRILRQLLHNALRFTAIGRITIRLALDDAPVTAPAVHHLRIDIEDQGPGIGGDLQHLFEPFTKPTHLGGSGFGLALAYKQARSIQAGLRAAKRSGMGSRFTLELPVSTLEAQDLIEPDHLFVVEDELSSDLRHYALSGKVLLVLDGQEQQRAVAYHLERLGLRTEIMVDSELTPARLQEESFPIVVLDWHKSDVPALHTVQRLREENYPGAIFALGDQLTADDRENFMLAGGNGVLNRPIVPAVWRQALAIYLPAEDDASPNESMMMIQSSLEHDREFMTLVRAFVAKLPAVLAEMRAALQVADLAHLIKKVHALVDSGQLYGYPALAAEAQRLEESILHGRDTPTISRLLDSLETLMCSIDRGIKFPRSAGTIALPSPLTIAA